MAAWSGHPDTDGRGRPSHPIEDVPASWMRCGRCGGIGVSLGALGARLWLRCRGCGHEWYTFGNHYE